MRPSPVLKALVSGKGATAADANTFADRSRGRRSGLATKGLCSCERSANEDFPDRPGRALPPRPGKPPAAAAGASLVPGAGRSEGNDAAALSGKLEAVRVIGPKRDGAPAERLAEERAALDGSPAGSVLAPPLPLKLPGKGWATADWEVLGTPQAEATSAVMEGSRVAPLRRWFCIKHSTDI